jgi:hypothetical protein
VASSEFVSRTLVAPLFHNAVHIAMSPARLQFNASMDVQSRFRTSAFLGRKSTCPITALDQELSVNQELSVAGSTVRAPRG